MCKVTFYYTCESCCYHFSEVTCFAEQGVQCSLEKAPSCSRAQGGGVGALTHRQAGLSGAVTRVQRGAVKFAQILIFKSRPQTQRLRRLPGWQAQPQKWLRPARTLGLCGGWPCSIGTTQELTQYNMPGCSADVFRKAPHRL